MSDLINPKGNRGKFTTVSQDGFITESTGQIFANKAIVEFKNQDWTVIKFDSLSRKYTLQKGDLITEAKESDLR
jgi:hypothetical protein